MPWLLALHITALVCWCGALLYLPALTAVTLRSGAGDGEVPASFSRAAYTLLVTPAALLAIASGTALFLVSQTVAGWLVVKLTLVAGLVLCHVVNGWMILHFEKAPRSYQTLICVLLGAASAALMVPIIWLVLAKPF